MFQDSIVVVYSGGGEDLGKYCLCKMTNRWIFFFYYYLQETELEAEEAPNMVMEVEEGFDAEEEACSKSWLERKGVSLVNIY